MRRFSQSRDHSRWVRLLVAVVALLTPCVAGAQALTMRPAQVTQDYNVNQARSELTALFGTLTPDLQAELATVARAAIDKAIRQVLVERAVVEPLTSGTLSASQQQVTVVADVGEVNGRALFSIPLGPSVDGQFTLTAPLSSGNATFANTGGLTPNASINGSLKWTIWTRTQPVKASAVADLIQTLNLITVGAESQTSGSQTDQLLADLEMARRAGIRAPTIARSVSGAGYPRLARIVGSASVIATPERFYSAIVQQVPQLTKTDWAGYMSAGADSNHHSVDYLTPDDFATKTYDKTVQMATISGGVSRMGEFDVPGQDPIKRPLFFAGASFKGGRTIDVADSQKICRPIGTGGAVECVEGPVGEPVAASGVSFTAEGRFWSWGTVQSIGFNPRYTYSRTRPDSGDTKTVHTLEVPIYFMQQVKDVTNPDITFGANLIGGVSVGWRQTRTPVKTQEGAFVMLFLTKAFGLP